MIPFLLDNSPPPTWRTLIKAITTVAKATGATGAVTLGLADTTGLTVGDVITVAGATGVTGATGAHTIATILGSTGITYSNTGATGAVSATAATGTIEQVPADASGSIEDEATSLRHTLFADRVNYFTSQRWQGDLFYRDLRIAGFLGSRTGLCFNQPKTQLLTGKWLSLANFTVTDPQMIVVGLQCMIEGVTGATGTVLEVVNLATGATGTIVASKTANDKQIMWDGVNMIPAGQAVEIRLHNTSGATVVAEGLAILQPRTY